jgi:hypothetical protein
MLKKKTQINKGLQFPRQSLQLYEELIDKYPHVLIREGTITQNIKLKIAHQKSL